MIQQRQFNDFSQRNNDLSELERIKFGISPPNEKKAKKIKPFIMIPKDIFKMHLGLATIGFYCFLKYLENQYGVGKQFFQTDKQLAELTNASPNTIGKYRKKLADNGLIIHGRKHFDTKEGKKSECTVEHYQFPSDD